MANNLGSTGFHNHGSGAGSVHLASALLLGILTGFTPSVSLARRASSRTPTPQTDHTTRMIGASGLGHVGRDSVGRYRSRNAIGKEQPA
jgi:hypothetical protein